MRLLPQHRTVLALLGFLLLAGGLSYWIAIHPLRTEIADNEETVASKRKILLVTGFPLNSELLGQRLQILKKQIEGSDGKPGIKTTTQSVLLNATRMFMDQIVAGHQNPDRFRRHATLAVFQADFSRMTLRLAERGVYLAPTVLGISDESSSPYIYQLILQAWTAERLADLADQEGLAFASVDDVEVNHGGKKVKAADIRLLDVRGYTLADTDKIPYLVEFPVQAMLLGELGQVKSFLRKLTSGGNFLPATHVEIYTDDPALPMHQDGHSVRVTRVRVRVQCSSFFVLGMSGEPVAGPSSLPSGA